MTVYAEFVFLSNVVVDAFIGALSVIVLRAKIGAIRLFLFSITGGLVSCVYPLVGDYGYLLKALCALLLPVFLIKIDKFKTYCTIVAVFVAISFGMGGAVLALNVLFHSGLSFVDMTYGRIPLIISCAGLIIIILYSICVKNRVHIANKNGNVYKVSIKNDNGFCNCRAFYDTGNRVYTNYGERVIIVSERVYNKLMPAREEEISIYTPSGIDGIRTTDAELVIYFPSGVNKIYNVKAGKGRVMGGVQIILHSDMSEEGE